jgi:hypothetical protein
MRTFIKIGLALAAAPVLADCPAGTTSGYKLADSCDTSAGWIDAADYKLVDDTDNCPDGWTATNDYTADPADDLHNAQGTYGYVCNAA